MAVPLTAIAAFVFYLNAVPVKFALTLRLSRQSGCGAGISIFEGRFALKNALRRAFGEEKHLPWKKFEVKLPLRTALPALFHSTKYILRHIKLEKLTFQGRICAPDAAQTALICGCAGALEGAVSPFAPPGAVRMNLQPDFSGGGNDALFCGMVSLPLGHIMLAALIGAGELLKRRIQDGKASH